MSKLEFWYDFASTYSYLSALRIDRIASAAGVGVVWRPFLLGPIFKAQGWTTSPFNIFPAKGRYMVRDIQRIAHARGIDFVMPPVFPAAGLLASRLALATDDADWTRNFSRRVFEAQFQDGADIADVATLTAVVRRSDPNADPAALLETAGTEAIKQRLKLQSQRAMDIGIFGAPSFIADDGEMFWGDDRAEQAVQWAQQLLSRVDQKALK